MALVLADRVRETTTVTGTGTATLLGAVSGYQSFAAVGNANTTYYVIANQSASEWEVGIGTYTASGTTLSRDTVLSSSNSGSLVNFSAGTKDVFVDYPAGRAVYEDAAGNVDGYPITGGTINNTVIGGTTPAAGTFTTLTATGQTSLGGASGSESLVVLTPAATGSALQVQAGATYTELKSSGTATNATLRLISKGTGSINFSTNNTQGTIQASVSHTASAVNYVQVTGAATLTGGPTLSAQGSDFNIPLRLQSKGIGGVELGNPAGWAGFTVTTTNNPNRIALNAPATGLIPTFSTAGVDTNAGMAFISKGTGAIDLAAGSSGINISNGGTVTAITRTAGGSGYTTAPTVAISAPTTAGGVQATATVAMFNAAATIASGGTGYTVGNTLTMVGGTISAGFSVGTFTVTSVSAGAVTGVAVLNFSSYTVLPSNPVTVTGGTGTGCTLNVTYGIGTSFTITNAGSGYVEQPTVSFSGGGGSGAAAYASVGSVSVLKALNTFALATNAGTHLQLLDGGSPSVNFLRVQGSSSGASVFVGAAGSDTNVSSVFYSRGTGFVDLSTSSASVTQLRVSHTASAVNYVQVTGAATGASPTISAQGSDTNVSITVVGKGSGDARLQSSSTGNAALLTDGGLTALRAVPRAASGDTFIDVQRNVGFVDFIANSGVTNGDIRFTPKGTGNVRFGTYTANMALTIQGYIEIKDSGGTVRKLAVIA